MKIAIIGAGLSGLCCALEFVRHGITPTVFEKKNAIGRDTNFIALNLRIFNRNRGDALAFLRKKYGLELKPLSVLKEITMTAPGAKTVIKGRLGYLFKRGEGPCSVENQLALKAGIPICYDCYVRLNDIRNEFDYIIAATGDDTIAKELGVWHNSLNIQTRVATALGDFRTGSADMWLNTEFARNSFCSLIPVSRKHAFISLLVENTSCRELDHYWKKFLSSVDFLQDITEIADHEQNIGFASPVAAGNVLITGNPAGMIDCFLGFGTLNAMESGFLAARSILCGLDYTRLIQPIFRNAQALYRYRSLINTFNNTDYNRLVAFLGLPVVKQLVYNNPLFLAKDMAPLAELYLRFANRFAPDTNSKAGE